jgi:hypothetical protein
LLRIGTTLTKIQTLCSVRTLPKQKYQGSYLFGNCSGNQFSISINLTRDRILLLWHGLAPGHCPQALAEEESGKAGGGKGVDDVTGHEGTGEE